MKQVTLSFERTTCVSKCQVCRRRLTNLGMAHSVTYCLNRHSKLNTWAQTRGDQWRHTMTSYVWRHIMTSPCDVIMAHSVTYCLNRHSKLNTWAQTREDQWRHTMTSYVWRHRRDVMCVTSHYDVSHVTPYGWRHMTCLRCLESSQIAGCQKLWSCFGAIDDLLIVLATKCLATKSFLRTKGMHNHSGVMPNSSEMLEGKQTLWLTSTRSVGLLWRRLTKKRFTGRTIQGMKELPKEDTEHSGTFSHPLMYKWGSENW